MLKNSRSSCCHPSCCNNICYRYIAGPPGPPGPRGPQGEPGLSGTASMASAGLAAYGGKYQAGTQPLLFTQPDTYIQIQLNTQLPSSNVTYPSANSITIQQSGDYEIHYNILFTANQTANIAIGVRQNGVIIPQTRETQAIGIEPEPNPSYNGKFSVNTIAALRQNDTVDLAVAVLRALPDNLDAVVNATLMLKKLNA